MGTSLRRRSTAPHKISSFKTPPLLHIVALHFRTLRKRLVFHSRSSSLLLLVPTAICSLLAVSIIGAWGVEFALPATSDVALDNAFLARTPTANDTRDSARNRMHIAMIFDENRYDFSISVVRSLAYYSRHPLTLHLIAPVSLHETLANWPSELPSSDVHVVTHNYELCLAPTSLISHIARDIHMSAMCKVFLAEIVPAEHVLYIDTDVTVVSDIAHCWVKDVLAGAEGSGSSFGRHALIAMGADMGEACQSLPDKCYPIGMRFKIPRGLECGTTPQRAKIVRAEGRKCQSQGEYEPFQFNGGVALMHLARMRSERFSARFVQSSIHTWRALGYRQARWGEQDLLNNFFRHYPRAVVNLPCGCNYQYSAARRESKCANQTVVIAHGWTRQLLDTRSHDRYNLHFNYFRRADLDCSPAARGNLTPPRAPNRSRIAPDWSPPSLDETSGLPVDAAFREHDPTCSLQSYHCPVDDFTHAGRVSIGILADTVNVLTRTARRPRFFSEMAASVREQTHPSVHHVVGSDDSITRSSYLAGFSKVTDLTPAVRNFDPAEVCRKCTVSGGVCGRAPGLDRPKARQAYLDCYCSTTYPMNAYINVLHKETKPGWIVYLDDDNMFEHRFALSALLASIKSRNSLVAFRSHLGRLTPSDDNFVRQSIAMGDFDSSNFAFHTDHLAKAHWDTRRCGDFRVARTLASSIPTEWVDHTFIQANPLRAGLGGLGRRTDAANASVTVVVTSYLSTGWRPRWVREIVDTYTAPDMHHLVAKVVLVWNSPTEKVPQSLVDAEGDRFVIAKMYRNSLNNRWVAALEHIDTDVVLNLDDDVYVKKEGLVCLLSWYRQLRDPRRMVGPFVRRIDGTKYVIDELTDSGAYSVLLPRVLMLPTSLMREYARPDNEWAHNYIDKQEAHCDDVFLNLVAQKSAPPLRVLLPDHTLVDFYSKCFSVDSIRTGGLALQKNRAEKRSACVADLMRRFGAHSWRRSDKIGTCLARGNAAELRERVEVEQYKLMSDSSAVRCEGAPSDDS